MSKITINVDTEEFKGRQDWQRPSYTDSIPIKSSGSTWSLRRYGSHVLESEEIYKLEDWAALQDQSRFQDQGRLYLELEREIK